MDYRVKTKIGDIELFETADVVTRTEDEITYQFPSISNIKLLDNATIGTMEIGVTPSDCLTFTINNPNKQSYDGETVELWVAPPEDDTFEMQERAGIVDTVGSDATDEGIEEGDNSDELDDADDSEGDEPSAEDLEDATAATTETIESVYTALEGEPTSVSDEDTDEAEEPEWIRIGTFFVQAQTNADDGSAVTLTCYDSMQKLNRRFFPTNTTATVQSMFNDLRSQASEALGVIIDEFDYDEDASRSITMPSPVTYREVLGWFAGLMGGFATCDDDGSIGFALYSFTDGLYLDSALNYLNVDASGEIELDGIECDIGFIQENIISSGFESDLSFKNPFMTQDVLDGILANYKGIRFSGGALNMTWDASIDAGSFIRVMTPDEYKNYLELQNALDAGGTEEEVLDIKSNMNELGTVLLVSYQIIDFTGDATTTIASVSNSATQNENQLTSPTDAKFNKVTAKIVETEQLVAEKADITDLQAATGRISTLETDNASVKGRLDAAEADIDTLEADHVSVSDLNAANANITSLQTGKADIDAANITTLTNRNAWIDTLLVQSGLIAHSGTIYTLDAIQVNASNITAGTLDVERLIVTQNGQKYLVHVDDGTPTYEKLDGNIIEDLTITADKIVAGAITAQKITTENLVGSGGWINLRNGTFNYANATSGEGISWDGTNLSITGSLTVTSGNVYTKTEADANFLTDIDVSVEQTATGADITVNGDTVSLANGANGTTFTPSVNASGVISWTNDGGKTNPTSVNIMGPQGPAGAVYYTTGDDTPEHPYVEGEIWVKQTTTYVYDDDDPTVIVDTIVQTATYVCVADSVSEFSEEDWVLASTDDTFAEEIKSDVDDLSDAMEASDNELRTAIEAETEARETENALKVDIGSSGINTMDNNFKMSSTGLEVFKNGSDWEVIIANNGVLLALNNDAVASIQQYENTNETLMKANNALMSNLRLRPTSGTGLLGIVAQSNGHVSMKEI